MLTFLREVLLSGFITIVLVQIVVWIIGFRRYGVRKGSLAANLVRNHLGRIPQYSCLALMQSVGAGGIGVRRSFAVFLCAGTVACCFWIYVLISRVSAAKRRTTWYFGAASNPLRGRAASRFNTTRSPRSEIIFPVYLMSVYLYIFICLQSHY